MRQEVEKLLLWLIPLIAISTVAETAITNFVLEMVSNMRGGVKSMPIEPSWIDLHFSLGEQVAIANWAKLLPMFVVQFVIGVWLFFQAKRTNSNRWVWFFAGLLLKYWALALFLLTQIVDHKAKEGAAANK